VKASDLTLGIRWLLYKKLGRLDSMTESRDLEIVQERILKGKCPYVWDRTLNKYFF
jgi:hypothetical protein